MSDGKESTYSGHFSRPATVTASVEWGYEAKAVSMDAHAFNRIIQGHPEILGSRYVNDGVEFIARWAFNCPDIGALQVFFAPEDDDSAESEAVGFDGRIDEALFEIDGREYDFGKGFRPIVGPGGDGR